MIHTYEYIYIWSLGWHMSAAENGLYWRTKILTLDTPKYWMCRILYTVIVNIKLVYLEKETFKISIFFSLVCSSFWWVCQLKDIRYIWRLTNKVPLSLYFNVHCLWFICIKLKCVSQICWFADLLIKYISCKTLI